MEWLSFLQETYWQGVAGIAQVFAGLFAVFTILQARTMIEQAEKDRQDSASPDWDCVSTRPVSTSESNVIHRGLGLDFLNTGFGPARNIVCSVEPLITQSLGFQGYRGNAKIIVPGDILTVSLNEIDLGKASETILTIKCTTRFSNQALQRFRIEFTPAERGHFGAEVSAINLK